MPDILIRVEMPKNCMACSEPYEPFSMHRKCYVDGHVFLYSYVHGRDKDCPLHELPPHGDLIDADSLVDNLLFDVELARRALDDTYIVGQTREQIQFEKDCKQNCADYVKESPVVVPAERGDTDA